MRRRRAVVGMLAVAIVAIVAATAIMIVRSRDVGAAGESSAPPATGQGGDDTGEAMELIAVEQRDLVRSETFDGTVGHGEQSALRLDGAGTVTRLPNIGDVLQFGQVIAEVDGGAVVFLQGDRPEWRAIGPRTGKGEDVRQLEAALVAMGYADPAEVTVDDTWTSATTVAVKAMQKLSGMPVDGQLETSEIVFGPEPVRIAEITGDLGDDAASAGIETSQLEQSIDVPLSASKSHLVEVGDRVDIELPDGETLTGTVDSIGNPETSEDGKRIVPVVISTGAIDLADGTPVEVTVDIVAVADAVAVPAAALLALAEGGYAVETPDTSSATGRRLIAVEIGEFADGWVQVTGDVAAGDQVLVP